MKKIRVTPKKKKIIPANRKTTSFPIVGIGASAGGLKHFRNYSRICRLNREWQLYL